MKTGGPIHASRYWILEMMDLPEDVQVDVECPGNDLGTIVNPRYHTKLNQWLKENGYPFHTDGQDYNSDVCFIAWWSW